MHHPSSKLNHQTSASTDPQTQSGASSDSQNPDVRKTWFLEVVVDSEWASANLASPISKSVLHHSFSGQMTTVELFGDQAISVIRVWLAEARHLEDAQAFQAQHLSKMLDLLELTVGVQTGFPLRLQGLLGSSLMLVFAGCEDRSSQFPFMQIERVGGPKPIDFSTLAILGAALANPGGEDYVFLLNRVIDFRLEVDYRWLCAFRMVERYFNKKMPDLDDDKRWRLLLGAIEADFGVQLKGARWDAMQPSKRLAHARPYSAGKSLLSSYFVGIRGQVVAHGNSRRQARGHEDELFVNFWMARLVATIVFNATRSSTVLDCCDAQSSLVSMDRIKAYVEIIK